MGRARTVGAGWSITYRHIQNDNGGNESNTRSADDAAGAHDTEASGSSLENATDGEYETTRDDGSPTSNEVGEVTGDDSAEKGTAGENGGGEGLIACWQMESLDSGSIIGVRVRQASVLTDEVFHGQDTTHPASVVTEEDTTEGSEGTDEVGPHGDGGLEPRRVRRARNDNGCYTSSRHDGGDVR